MVIHIIKKIIRKSSGKLTVRIAIALIGAFILNLFFGLFFYLVEHGIQDELTLVDSIWWAMVTMTTVGYGDYSPQTWQGRFLVSYPCFILGIGLIGYLLGMLAESMIDLTAKRKKGTQIIRMKGHIIICHCPSIQRILNIVRELRASKEYLNTNFVVVSDSLEERPDEFQKEQIVFIKGNPEEETILRKAKVEKSNGVIALAKIPGDSCSDASTFTIITLVELISEELNHNIKTVAELINQKSNKLFSRSDVDGTVTVEGQTDKMMVQEFLHPGINSTFEQLLTNTSGSQLYTCKTKLIGRKFVSLQAAALEHQVDLQIIGLNRADKQLLNPSKQIVITTGDKLIVLAERKNDFFIFENDQLAKS